MTAPHIGNTGVNDEDQESDRIWVAGFVVRDPSRVVSNYRAKGSLEDSLTAQGIVGISGIDTRAVTRRLRSVGVMRAGIFSGDDAGLGDSNQLDAWSATPRRWPDANLSSVVSVHEAVHAPGARASASARSPSSTSA